MVTLQESPPQTHSRILGLGAYRGEVIVSNDDICEWIDSSDEWIQQRTGIVTRRRATPEVSVVDMAVIAAQDALNNAGVSADQLSAVLVSTVTHSYATPSAATLVADRLGAGDIPAYDFSAACAGYCYGITQADALVRSGAAEYVLVIGVEKLSDVINNHERSISFILGDGAGAAIIGPSETPGISASVWGSDGSKWDAVGMSHSIAEAKNRAKDALNATEPVTVEEINELIFPTLRQDGPTVFRWAVWEMAKVARAALDAAGVQVEDLAAFVPHQANLRIINSLVKELKLPDTVQVARDVVETGNTSAASIPLATHRLLQEHPEIAGGLSLQIGFGAGLVFGAQVVVLPELKTSS